MGTINKTTSEINALLNQVGTTSSEVAGLDTRLDTAEGTLVTLDTRLDSAEGTMVTLDTRLDTAEGALVTLDARLDTIESRFYKTPEDFNAVGDGVTDDSTAIYNAINYCSQNGIKLTSHPSKTYRIASNQLVYRAGHKPLIIDFNGATLFLDNASFEFPMPSAFLTTTLSTELTKGLNYIDLSSVAGVVVGDFIEITCPYKSGPDHNDSLHYYVVHEITANRVYIEGRIISDISVSQITLDGGTGNLASFVVKIYHLNESIRISNVNLKIADIAGIVYGAIEINGCKNLWVDNTNVTGRCRTQLYIRRNAYDIVTNCVFDNFGYTNDLGITPPLVSGTPNEFGYGILREGNWMSLTSNCIGRHGWHAFDDAYGQMHSLYSDCVTERVSGGFSTHNGVWNVYYDNCSVLGTLGFNTFRACNVEIKNCKTDVTTIAISLSAINHNVSIENCNLYSDGTSSQVIFVNLPYTSSNRNPKTANPSMASVGHVVQWNLINNRINSKNNSNTWSFGIDNVNTDSTLNIIGNTFNNVGNWANGAGCLHQTSIVRDNKLIGSISSQFWISPTSYATSSGAKYTFENNSILLNSASTNGAMLYLVTPNANFTVNMLGNTINMPSVYGLIRCNTGGDLNIEYFENNISNGRLLGVNTASPTTVTITNLNDNIYNSSSGVSNTETGLTITSSVNNTNRNLVFNQPAISWGTAAPVSGARKQGDIVYNSAPAASGTIGWVCTVAGSPGTWKTFGTISA